MSTLPMNAQQVLDRYFLETRAKLLDIAANLDRIDRAQGSLAASRDSRRRKIDEALSILGGKSPDRAELIQLLFSREYNPKWMQEFDLPVEANA